MKTKILVDFQICISVPMSRTKGVLKQSNKSTTAVCEIHGPQTK